MDIQNVLGYTFNNPNLLKTALTHSSFANEHKLKSNERLEFLGDSVLSLITAQFLFEHYNKLPEGELTKTRAALVCEQTLYRYAKDMDLGKFLYLGKGEEITNGRQRPSLLADAFEAVLAAIYLDGGIDAAKKFLTPFLDKYTEASINGNTYKDYKTILQEIVQKNPGEQLAYNLISESGPAHNKHFICEVCLNSNVLGKGEGKSKKEAEQNAAKIALELMGL